MASTTHEDIRTTMHEIAEAIAPTWERRRPQLEEVTTPVREWMVRELAPSDGETIVELAAGVGDTGFDAAELIGGGGRLITTDFSSAMLEAARRRGAERGVRNAEYRVVDAEQIELDDGAADGVLCRFGYMLMVDPAAALGETRRVLRPGGRLVLAVWGPPEQNPFLAVAAMKLVERGHMPPPDPPPAPGPFSMASPDRTRGLLAAAGFGEVRITEVEVRFAFPDVGEYLDFIADTAGPIGLTVRGLSAEDRTALSTEIKQVFEPFASGDGYELTGVALCAVAR